MFSLCGADGLSPEEWAQDLGPVSQSVSFPWMQGLLQRWVYDLSQASHSSLQGLLPTLSEKTLFTGIMNSIDHVSLELSEAPSH